MRVGRNLNILGGPFQGGGSVVEGQLREILRQSAPGDGEEYVFYSSAPESMRARFDGPAFSHKRLWPRWPWLQKLGGAAIAQVRDRLDVYHGEFSLPLVNACPTVVTLHDMLHRTCPEQFADEGASLWRMNSELSSRRATLIVTGSEFSREEILQVCAIPGERVRTIPLGVDPERFRRVDDPGAFSGVRARYGLPARFALNTGHITLRKNLHGLIRALGIYRERSRDDLQLVLTGPYQTDQAMRLVRQATQEYRMSGAVRILGSVAAEDLPALYSLAAVFVFPSFAEGFGLPLLEAMACGTPVISSNRTSLPEVGGSVPLYFEPSEPEELSEKLAQILDDSALREEKIREGLRHAAAHSWTAGVRMLRQAYRELAGADSAI